MRVKVSHKGSKRRPLGRTMMVKIPEPEGDWFADEGLCRRVRKSKMACAVSFGERDVWAKFFG